VYATEEELLNFIEKNYIQYNPQEKLNNVLDYISSMIHYDGEAISISIAKDISEPQLWRKYYFENENEYLFYIENLRDQGLISYDTGKGYLLNLKITLTGLTALLKINAQRTSRYCFIAMSFNSILEAVYDNGILPALNETGFLPFIFRKEHVNSEVTINDAIIAGIKKAHFTIADFTEHRPGVYFEAGYALGRGQKVIYTCRKDGINEAHFDTRNYQHVVWETPEDLKQKLIDKIHAFILE
jgi:hypothetical protein